jgi:hypothetical protein
MTVCQLSPVTRKTHDPVIARAGSALCLALVVCSGAASASGIPSAVIAPHEFDLPLNFTPITEFVEYGYVNDDNRVYTLDGRTTDGPGGASDVGIAKLAYLAPLGDRFGYELEVLLPLIRVTGRGSSALGAGDPIFAPVIWFKPTGNSTLGTDVLIQPAWGAERYTAHDLVVTPTLFYDVNWRKFNLDGDVGVSLPDNHDREIAGIRSPANTLFANVRFAYTFSTHWSPFLSADWRATGQGRNASDQSVPDSRSRELAVGGGVMWQPRSATSLAVSYSRSVSGANVVQTNALYFRYVNSW